MEKAIEKLNERGEGAAERALEMTWKGYSKIAKFYARELEIKLANFEKEKSSKEGARLQREEERKALANKVEELESIQERQN